MWAIAVLFVAGAFVGWNIGSNDAANCIGTSVGSELLSFRRAIVLVSVFAVVGGLTQMANAMLTLATGIITSEIPRAGILVGMLSSGIFVTIARLRKCVLRSDRSCNCRSLLLHRGYSRIHYPGRWSEQLPRCGC